MRALGLLKEDTDVSVDVFDEAYFPGVFPGENPAFAGRQGGESESLIFLTEEGVMKKLLVLVAVLVVSLSGATPVRGEVVSWDFENGNDHGFELTGLKDGTLPEGGSAWSIGPPNQFDGQAPAVDEGCHVVDGLLQYGPCNDPFGVFREEPPNYTNLRGQSSYLNTYNLSQWGDGLHTADNDQIATSPVITVPADGLLQVWSFGNTSAGWAQPRHAPELDPDLYEGYTTGSGGIAVVSEAAGSLLAGLLLASQSGPEKGMPKLDELDISALAGQQVRIQVVDAFAGGWGWIAVDEIAVVPEPATVMLLGLGGLALIRRRKRN